MSYAVELAPEVTSKLQQLPAEVGERVLDEIERLTQSPTRLSQRAVGTYRLHQTFRFEVIVGGITYHFTVDFQYSQDEQTLHLLHMAVDPTP